MLDLTSGELLFHGNDGTECERFIRAVRRHGFLAGKSNDHEFMAAFAATCMAGKAFRWHANLDDAIRNDWRLLEKAILQQYDDRGDDTMEAEVASTTSPVDTEKGKSNHQTTDTLDGRGPITARIKVMSADQQEHYGYICKKPGWYGEYYFTQKEEDAMVIQCMPHDERQCLHMLGMNQAADKLGARWLKPGPSIGGGSFHYTRFVAIDTNDPNELKSPATGSLGPMQAAIWRVTSTGLLTASWAFEDGSERSLVPMADTRFKLVYLSPDPAAYTAYFQQKEVPACLMLERH